MPGLDKGKGLYFLFIKSETKTPGGLPARPVLTSYYKSEHFKHRPYDPYNVYTSPTATILCTDSFQSMYSQMLCGLVARTEVLRVGAVFASGLLRAIRFLQLHWKELAHDLRTGTLSARVVEPSIREAVGEVLTKPDPGLADFVEAECGKDSWEGIITRVWPNTKYLDVIVTGAMAQYIPTLKYYSGGLPMACTMYASSECYFGLNLRPMCDPSEVSYTIMPNMGYFKLLSHDPADANVKPVSARDDTPPSPMEKGLVGEEERSPSCLGSSKARGVRHCATRSTACCCARRKRSLRRRLARALRSTEAGYSAHGGTRAQLRRLRWETAPKAWPTTLASSSWRQRRRRKHHP